jgi:hypothetical protein
MNLRRGEGFWTVAEHVSHLAQVQPMLLDRFQRFINEDHPEFESYSLYILTRHTLMHDFWHMYRIIKEKE